MNHLASMVISLLAAVLSLTGITLFAQTQPRIEIPANPPGGLDGNFGVLASTIATSFCAVAYAWINASSSTQKRRLEESEKKVTELQTDLKAIDADRNRWMRRAYRLGYKDIEGVDNSKDSG